MYRNYKIVAVVPAGRRKHLEILMRYFEMNKGILDGVQLWRNPTNCPDCYYIDSLKSDFVRIIPVPVDTVYCAKRVQLNTSVFYRYTTDVDTIYVRFDDDIVYIDDQFFKNIIDFRIDNPDYFLIFANIINNAYISWILLRDGLLPATKVFPAKPKPNVVDNLYWGEWIFARYIHRFLLDKIATGKQNELFFDREELIKYRRFSISCFAFFGKDFTNIGDKVGIGLKNYGVEGAEGNLYKNEETWLSIDYPPTIERINCICGSALCSHYAFFSQRKHLDENSNIFQRYSELCDQKYHDAYCDLLGNV